MTGFDDFVSGGRPARLHQSAAERDKRERQVRELKAALWLVDSGNGDLLDVLGLERWARAAELRTAVPR